MNEATENEQPAQKFFYFLVTGNLLFSFERAEGEEDVSTTIQSCIVRSDREEFPVKNMVRGQRNLQAIAYQKIGDIPKLAIRDVVITNICPLGWMTEDDFQQLPEEIVQASQPQVLRTAEDLKNAVNGDGIVVE